MFYDILQHRYGDKLYQASTPHFCNEGTCILTTPPLPHPLLLTPHHYITLTTTPSHTPITQIHILTTPIHIPTIPTHTHSTTYPYCLCPYPTTHTHPTHILPNTCPHVSIEHTHSHTSSPQWCFPALQGPHHPTPPPAPHLSHPPHHCPVNAST